MRILDGLVNLVSGLGTTRDKSMHASYGVPTFTPIELVTAYKASSLIRRAVDLPAEDACREWREWQAESADISAIEAEESRLGVQVKVLQARMLARLFGGAALLIGDGSANPSLPINARVMKRGGLKYLTLLNMNNLSAGSYDRDPASENFGRPEYWNLNAGSSGGIRVHPSRAVIFHGIAPTNTGYETETGWGDSNLPGMMDALTRVDEVMGNITSLVYEAKVDVIKIPDFMKNLQSRGTAYSDEVVRRATLAATAKGINGVLLLDSLEDYDQKNASFAGLPDILDRAMQLASAASGIPMTLLFGMSPAGMNATGEGDQRGYYDRVKVEQTLHIQPAMSVLDECLIRSALGDRPSDIHYNWRPLWQPTAKERAENGKLLADAMKVVWDTDTVPAEAIGKALVNGLTECGAFPGLEGYVSDMTDPTEGDDSEDAKAATVESSQPKPAVVADATPRSLYVRRDVLNAAEITAWAKAQGFLNIVQDLHITVAYSKTAVDWFKVGQSWADKLDIAAGGPRQMERLGPTGEYIALLITANELIWRNREIREAGASWNWPDYQPHISIQIGGDIDLSKVEPYRGKIVLGPEIFEEVKQ